MATPQLSPGVLVREVDLTIGRAENVLDNIGAIAGPFEIGPVDDIIEISTEEQLVNTFEKTNKISIDYDIGERRKGDSAISYANSEYSHSILKWRPNRNLETMCLDGWKWYLYLINEKK